MVHQSNRAAGTSQARGRVSQIEMCTSLMSGECLSNLQNFGCFEVHWTGVAKWYFGFDLHSDCAAVVSGSFECPSLL